MSDPRTITFSKQQKAKEKMLISTLFLYQMISYVNEGQEPERKATIEANNNKPEALLDSQPAMNANFNAKTRQNNHRFYQATFNKSIGADKPPRPSNSSPKNFTCGRKF